MPEPDGDATAILAALTAGDQSAAERLMPLVYDELRGLAASYMHRQPPGQTLDPTGLVHEAFVRLVAPTGVRWQDRAHFFATAATAMRRILADRVRARLAAKRGDGWQRMTVADVPTPTGESQVDLIALEEALTKLGVRSERQGRVVELRFFGGLNVEATAHVLGISKRSAENDWRVARAWLAAELEAKETGP